MKPLQKEKQRAKYRDNPGYHSRKRAKKKIKKALKHLDHLSDNKDKIIYLCKKFPRNYPEVLRKNLPALLKWINDNTPLLDDPFFKLSTKIYWILHGLKDFPTCLNEKCKKKIIKNADTALGFYPRFCNQTCINQSSIHIKNCNKTVIKNGGYKVRLAKIFKRYEEKTGYSSPFKNPKVRKKGKSTYKKRTGYDHNFKNPTTIQHRKDTWKSNYGVDHPMKCKKVKNKVARTCMKNFGQKTFLLTDQYNKHAKKIYEYKGFTFASTPELCFYIWLEDHYIDFIFQPNVGFKYRFDGKLRKYTPDFYLVDEDLYIDIKGTQFFEDHDPNKRMINPYDRSEDALYEAKHRCMKRNNVLIICNYQFALDYIVGKYGNEYLKRFMR